MKIKNKKDDKFLMCACCGKTFKPREISADELFSHQQNNESCKGYFKIEMVDKRS